MTLTLNIPTSHAQADVTYQENLRKAAALFDAGLITPEQAAELAGPSHESFSAELFRPGHVVPRLAGVESAPRPAGTGARRCPVAGSHKPREHLRGRWALSILVDTPCLLRLTSPDDPRAADTQAALGRLTDAGETPRAAPQNFVEFRSVATRPLNVNGLNVNSLGLTIAEVDSEPDGFGLLSPLLPEDGFYPVWRDGCRRAVVSGKEVHDTRLVVVCVVSGIATVLTWNPTDFTRSMPLVPGLTVRTPADVLAAP